MERKPFNKTPNQLAAIKRWRRPEFRKKVLDTFATSEKVANRGKEISASLIEKYKTDEVFAEQHRQKLVKARKHITEDSVKKMADKLRGRKATPAQLAGLLIGQKAKISDEHKQSISKAQMGRARSQADKQKTKDIAKAQWQNAEYREKQALSRSTSSYKKIRSEAAKERWADPKFKERVSTAIIEGRKEWVSSGEFKELMKQNRSKQVFPYEDTGIELTIQDFLSRHSISFVKHKVIKELHHTHQWDIAIPNLRIAVEVNGCYWHSCKICNLNNAHKHNDKPFDNEIDLVSHRAAKIGWRVLVLWEHEIKSESAQAILLNAVKACEIELARKIESEEK